MPRMNLWFEALVVRELLREPDAPASVIHDRVLQRVAEWVDRHLRSHPDEPLPADVYRVWSAWRRGGVSRRTVERIARRVRPWARTHGGRRVVIVRQRTCAAAGLTLMAVRRQRAAMVLAMQEVEMLCVDAAVEDARRPVIPPRDHVPAMTGGVPTPNGVVYGDARWVM